MSVQMARLTICTTLASRRVNGNHNRWQAFPCPLRPLASASRRPSWRRGKGTGKRGSSTCPQVHFALPGSQHWVIRPPSPVPPSSVAISISNPEFRRRKMEGFRRSGSSHLQSRDVASLVPCHPVLSSSLITGCRFAHPMAPMSHVGRSHKGPDYKTMRHLHTLGKAKAYA